jgi:hypothetical protein
MHGSIGSITAIVNDHHRGLSIISFLFFSFVFWKRMISAREIFHPAPHPESASCMAGLLDQIGNTLVNRDRERQLIVFFWTTRTALRNNNAILKILFRKT